ncbi:unnamed protein product [Lasius platythorax]|uniref:THAP domain-containing protein 9 n=1 Tax=Lasius platythorax TaxID=488582 RepID=A0AAV2NT62_9HYME
MHEVLKRRTKVRSKYSAELRAFALTLNFYSTKAYEYVRKTFNNLLPESSTISKWYRSINGRPGFTEEVLQALQCRVQNSDKAIICNLVIDEMSIRQQVDFDGNQYYGFEDFGFNNCTNSDQPIQATSALVFMLVALNDHWKVPIGYFLIHSLSGKERASILTNCLELLAKINVHIHSLTFDGASTNVSMCKELGANFELEKDFKPFFINPATKEKVLCVFDPCHMIKLVRNTLGHNLRLRNNEKEILFEDIKRLQKLQDEEGLKAGTRLTKKHIYFHNNRMNVKLAAQTLSESVSTALKFVDKRVPGYLQSPEETAKFCSIFNDAFDILNVRSKFPKPKKCNMPLSDSTFIELKQYAENIIEYIKNIEDCEHRSILKSNRRTGFLGLIICLQNIFELFLLLKEKGLEYLLTYKLNQDHLETFFSAIRSRGGFNNNPSAKHFESSYKRLLVRHEVKAAETGNCMINDIQILFVSSKKEDTLFIEEENMQITSSDIIFDHDYLSTLWNLSPYVDEVVKYISGFVIRKQLKNKNICDVCAPFLTASRQNMPKCTLIEIKTRGMLMFPSHDVVIIARTAETIIRANDYILFKHKNIKEFLILKTFQAVSINHRVFNDNIMTEHIKNQGIIDNHKTQLIKSIIKTYVVLRLFHEGKRATDVNRNEYIRHKFSKLILFKNQ